MGAVVPLVEMEVGGVLRVTVRGSGLPTVVLGTGESLLFGRSPQAALEELTPVAQLHATALTLVRSAPHVSRSLGSLEIGEEIVRLRWQGKIEAQLSSLFEAPGGARRVTLGEGMSALLDEGENTLVILRGRERAPGVFDDLQLVIDIESSQPADPGPPPETPSAGDHGVTAPAPRLEPDSREWFVALALAEPWLSGTDDYPRPPSNREIYERVLAWHGYAWNLDRSQRVDDCLRAISRIAFGPDDPFAAGAGRAQNVRFAIGRRAAEVRLVTPADLDRVVANARKRNIPPV